jgi:hypothetical protein
MRDFAELTDAELVEKLLGPYVWGIVEEISRRLAHLRTEVLEQADAILVAVALLNERRISIRDLAELTDAELLSEVSTRDGDYLVSEIREELRIRLVGLRAIQDDYRGSVEF